MRETYTRREVNRALLAVAVALAVESSRFRAASARHLFDFAIAGGFFHQLASLRDGLTAGERLRLVAEPDNPHDLFAVAVVHAGGAKLGFVPRAANEPVARLLARGAKVEAEVIGRLDIRWASEIPDDLVFTGFTHGDPMVRLTLVEG